MTHASEKTILIVDDEFDIRDYLSICMEDAGFNVETAEDGIVALEILEKMTPDFILLYLKMPRMSGVKVFRKLRRNPKWKNIPVIIVSGHIGNEYGDESIKELMADAAGNVPECILDKPVKPEKLVKAVAAVLGVETEDLP